jgi:RNA polymerase sigma-70 factor (ECF subfamily)
MFGFSPSDATIVRRTMKGCPQAFEALVFRYQKKAHAVARALGLRPSDVEDAVQEAFLQAFRDLPSLREPASFGGWFLNIVRHVSIKELRRASRGGGEAPLPPGGEVQGSGPGARPASSTAEDIEQKDFRNYLWRKVAELPQGTREAIFLYYYEGESVRAVARTLGISVSGAKKKLRSGREELREKLWRGLDRGLRETLPSAQKWRASGRRLALVVLASIPTSWTARAGALSLGSGKDAVALLRQAVAAARGLERPAFVVLAKKGALSAGAILLILSLFGGRAVWLARAPEEVSPRPAPAVSKAPRPKAAAPKIAAETKPSRASLEPEPTKTEEDKKEEDQAAGEETADSLNRGSVMVRVIWDDKSPAAGVSGQVIPWGTPDLYTDYRTFTTAQDGTAQVDGIFRGGAAVMLDRGGRVDLKVEPGETRDAVLEVPPGLNVEGVVVDQQGFPVAGARIWVSLSGHTNWGSEVAQSGFDGTFSVRAISDSKYIAARAPGHASSDLYHLRGGAGSTQSLRLVLNGPGGEVIGTLLDAAGRPVVNAQVMVGPEYSGMTMLDDGTQGLSPAPYRGFTDEEGAFLADSLAPGPMRLAVRALGFVPLSQEVEVPRGSATAVELTLERGAILSGNVRDREGKPLSGAQVTIGDFRDFLSIKAFSGQEGAYRLSGLPSGELEAYSQRPGFGKASIKLEVKGGESLRWNPLLSLDLEIRGRIVDENGTPYPSFVLYLEEVVLGQGGRRGTQKKVVTDEAGQFAFSELSDLPYRLSVREKDYWIPCAVLDEMRPSEEEQEVQIERQALSSAFFLGRVVDFQGNPVPEAKVFCYAQGGYRWWVSGKDGTFRAGPVPRGRCQLEIQPRGQPILRLGEQEIQFGEERDVGVHFLKPPLR